MYGTIDIMFKGMLYSHSITLSASVYDYTFQIELKLVDQSLSWSTKKKNSSIF